MSHKKTEVFALRMSGTEAENLRRAAKAAGAKPATWARERLLATVAAPTAAVARPQRVDRASRKHAQNTDSRQATQELTIYHIDDLGDDPLRRDNGAMRK